VLTLLMTLRVKATLSSRLTTQCHHLQAHHKVASWPNNKVCGSPAWQTTKARGTREERRLHLLHAAPPSKASDRQCLNAVVLGGKHWLRCSTSGSGTTRAQLAASPLCRNLKREVSEETNIENIPNEEGGGEVGHGGEGGEEGGRVRGGGGGGGEVGREKSRISLAARIGSV
jgi:hypothetical protein